MDILDHMDPELAAALAACPPEWMWWNEDLDDMAATRTQVAELRLAMLSSVPDEPGVVKEDRAISSQLSVRVYRPVTSTTATGSSPVLVWFHGGGYVMGSVDQ